MKYLYLIPVVIFMCFSYVQHNDYDMWLWIGAYCVGAAVSIMAIFKHYYKWLTLGVMTIYTIWAMALGVGIENYALSDEETREAGGLLVSAACMMFLFVMERRKS